MKTILIITSTLSLFFLVIVVSVLLKKWRIHKYKKAVKVSTENELELRKKGLKPFNFFPSGKRTKSVKVWARSYKDAQIIFQNNKRSGIYG
ncbi:hypothetical protein U6A24_12705 [Aquimarina gracilis]|uniref:Uncharacterized protein n=1 Tax=Aquimarina gracilis TaxID=874422 RepID=A0ABU5ZWR8_9FLAO|nr:hypothetical protein [Aquimarina gracilis]MEB3346330.1 hypothetical protein [Aquimarina gracilis]